MAGIEGQGGCSRGGPGCADGGGAGFLLQRGPNSPPTLVLERIVVYDVRLLGRSIPTIVSPGSMSSTCVARHSNVRCDARVRPTVDFVERRPSGRMDITADSPDILSDRPVG